MLVSEFAFIVHTKFKNKVIKYDVSFSDTELHKFKCELEADNKGITELLEKRSLDLDTNTNHTASSNNHYKESR